MSRYLEVKYRKNWLIKLHSQRTKRNANKKHQRKPRGITPIALLCFLLSIIVTQSGPALMIKFKDYGDKQVHAPRKSTSSVETACMCPSVVCLLIQRSSISCRLSFVWPAKRSQPITATKGFSRG